MEIRCVLCGCNADTYGIWFRGYDGLREHVEDVHGDRWIGMYGGWRAFAVACAVGGPIQRYRIRLAILFSESDAEGEDTEEGGKKEVEDPFFRLDIPILPAGRGGMIVN